MSGQFKDLWAERITNNETLLLREEFIDNIYWKVLNKIISTKMKDFSWYDNFLLPNTIKEKSDNWDVDMFLYSPNKDIEELVLLLKKSENILKYNKNDKTHSVLYYSNTINKKIQIDLHIINYDKFIYRENYFDYYRIPYLFFFLGIIFNKADLKIWFEWVFLKVDYNWEKKYFLIEKNIKVFMYKVLGLHYNSLKEINSYKDIIEILNKRFWDYNFFDHLASRHNNKFSSNEKLQKILKILNKNRYIEDLTPFIKTFREKIYNEYPYIKYKENNLKKHIQLSQIEKIKNREFLEYLFETKDIKNLTIEQKKLIWHLKYDKKIFFWLKDLYLKLKEINSETEIYLVGGFVRDLLLWKKPKDIDITGNLIPEDFISILDLKKENLTQKIGTVFFNYKWLEIEYTPFRSEWNYNDWRRPDFIEYSKDIREDAKRRDFTINWLYLSLKDFIINDFYNWINDLNNLQIKAIDNPDDRFTEDYLRIIRWLRLCSVIKWTIEENTFNSMIKHAENIDNIHSSRITKELFSWLDKWGIDFLKILDYFWETTKWKIKEYNFYNLLKIYNNLNKKEIYSLIFYICNCDINKFKNIPWSYSGKTKKMFLFSIKYLEQFNNTNIENCNDLALFLFSINSHYFYSKKDTNLFLIILINLSFILFNNDYKYILSFKKELVQKDIPYTYKKLINIENIDMNKLSENIEKKEIRNYLKKILINNYLK